jgi:5-methylcytosine-specific restriction endonuclease McrA
MEVQPPDILQNTVVLFSKNYLPLTRINLKRAIALLVREQAESLDMGNGKYWEIRSPSLILQISPQIRLKGGNPERHWKVPPVNRRDLLRRDNHTCQYCGSTKHLTIDHVIPRSKGGQHKWENVVTACERCNQTKGDRLPHEAGMVLQTKPKPPAHPALAFGDSFWQTQDWKTQETADIK